MAITRLLRRKVKAPAGNLSLATRTRSTLDTGGAPSQLFEWVRSVCDEDPLDVAGDVLVAEVPSWLDRLRLPFMAWSAEQAEVGERMVSPFGKGSLMMHKAPRLSALDTPEPLPLHDAPPSPLPVGRAGVPTIQDMTDPLDEPLHLTTSLSGGLSQLLPSTSDLKGVKPVRPGREDRYGNGDPEAAEQEVRDRKSDETEEEGKGNTALETVPFKGSLLH